MDKMSYFGDGAYCFANSMAMLLAVGGNKISPSEIEVLSGVGLGAHIFNNLLFFSWKFPDRGLDNALEILGFQSSRKNTLKIQPIPLEKLKKDLEKSPAVIGPLDMGFLAYNPRARYLSGADHFIFAYKMDDRKIYLHDPAGFPHVFLSLVKLKKSWQTDVGYGRENYSYWIKPRRLKTPSQKEIYQKAIKLFQALYYHADQKSKKENWIIGREAIFKTAKRVKTKRLSYQEKDHLTHFAFPLGARRALDFAAFFDGRHKNLAQLKYQQAEIFGQCQALATQKNWSSLAKTLEQLAEAEDNFKSQLMKQ